MFLLEKYAVGFYSHHMQGLELFLFIQYSTILSYCGIWDEHRNLKTLVMSLGGGGACLHDRGEWFHILRLKNMVSVQKGERKLENGDFSNLINGRQ